jgi:hypothetical protein
MINWFKSKEGYEKSIRQIKEEYEEKIKQIKEKDEKLIRQIKENYEGEIRDIHFQHYYLSNKHEQKIYDLKRKIAEIKEHEQKIDDLKRKIAEIKEDALDNKIKYLEKIEQLLGLLDDKVTKCT